MDRLSGNDNHPSPMSRHLLHCLCILLVLTTLCSIVLGCLLYHANAERDVLIAEINALKASISETQTFWGTALDQKPPSTSGDYVASVNGEKYHRPNCQYAKKILEKNRIYYESRDEAYAAGKTACSVCNP